MMRRLACTSSAAGAWNASAFTFFQSAGDNGGGSGIGVRGGDASGLRSGLRDDEGQRQSRQRGWRAAVGAAPSLQLLTVRLWVAVHGLHLGGKGGICGAEINALGVLNFPYANLRRGGGGARASGWWSERGRARPRQTNSAAQIPHQRVYLLLGQGGGDALWGGER